MEGSRRPSFDELVVAVRVNPSLLGTLECRYNRRCKVYLLRQKFKVIIAELGKPHVHLGLKI